MRPHQSGLASEAAAILIRTLAHLLVALVLVTPTLAVDNGTGDNLSDAQELVEAENWTAALPVLKRLVAGRPRDPDALNLLAYVLRHTGDYRNAEGFYLKALGLDPHHLGANEYLGELYVLTGAIDKAKERLAVVEAICGQACEEYLELKAVIDSAP
jgi:Flp pilus assembly protein TadD